MRSGSHTIAGFAACWQGGSLPGTGINQYSELAGLAYNQRPSWGGTPWVFEGYGEYGLYHALPRASGRATPPCCFVFTLTRDMED